MPSIAGDYTIAIALVFHLQHHPFVGLVNAGARFRHHPVEPRSLEAMEPIGSQRPVVRRRREMNGRLGVSKQRFQFLAAAFKWLTAQISSALAKKIEEHHG